MKNSDSDGLWFVFFGVGVLTGIILTGFIPGMPWTPIVTNPQLWLGNSGLIGSGVSILTLAGVIAAGLGVFLNNRNSTMTLESARQRERLERFERHVALLESSQMSSRIAGTKLLVELTTEFPRQFGSASTVVLESAISLIFLEEHKRVREFILENGKFPTMIGEPYNSINELLDAIYDIREARNTSERVQIESVCLSLVGFLGREMPNLLFNNAIFYRVGFDQCDLPKIRVHFVALDRVRFDDCDLSGGLLTCRSPMGGTVILTECDLRNTSVHLNGKSIILEKCNVSGLNIAGNSVEMVDCWIDGETPKIRVTAPNDHPTRHAFVAKKSTKSTTSHRGLEVLHRSRERMLEITALPIPDDMAWNGPEGKV